MKTGIVHFARLEISESGGKLFRVGAALCKPICGSRADERRTHTLADVTCPRCRIYAVRHDGKRPKFYRKNERRDQAR